MDKRVFISYCHAQGDWVSNRLVPCLRAGGADVLIDYERFAAGKAVVGQMDATQDAAETSVLVLSPAYLASDYCRHEMDRAIGHAPGFEHGAVIPVIREACGLPDRLTTLDTALYVDLQDETNAEQWHLLLHACGADLGVTASDWLNVRDDIRRFLNRRESVNLVAPGNTTWRELIEHIRADVFPNLGVVDLQQGFLRETPRLRELVHDITTQQTRLNTVSRPILRELIAQLLYTTIENFRHQVSGFREPLASEFRAAANHWLKIAQQQHQDAQDILAKEPSPQVFRAGDPVRPPTGSLCASPPCRGRAGKSDHAEYGLPGPHPLRPTPDGEDHCPAQCDGILTDDCRPRSDIHAASSGVNLSRLLRHLSRGSHPADLYGCNVVRCFPRRSPQLFRLLVGL